MATFRVTMLVVLEETLPKGATTRPLENDEVSRMVELAQIDLPFCYTIEVERVDFIGG